MGGRNLLVAAFLLAGLGAGVWWSNKTTKAEEAKPAKDSKDSPKIFAIAPYDLKKVEIVHKDGDKVVLNRLDEAKWQLTEPEKLGADPDSIQALLAPFGELKSDRLVEEKPTDLAPFGLTTPSLRVALTKTDGKPWAINFGDDTPAGSGVFAKVDGDPRVFVVNSSVRSSLDKSWKDLRDKRLLTIDPEKVSRVELSAKKQNVEFGRIGANEWQIVKPKPMRADGWQIEELVRKLREAKMDTTVSDEDAKKAATAFGSGTPVATAKLTEPSGVQQIEVRKVKDDYYAKSSVVPGVYKVAKDLGEGLDKTVDDFRNKKVFDFGFSDPTKVVVKDGGAEKIFQKSGEGWISSGKPMDPPTVQALIDKLRELSAKKFTDGGTVAPGFEVTVVSNDNKRTEKVLIAKSGDKCVAMREGEPTVYELDRGALDELKKAIGDIKPPAAAPAKTDTKKK
ncbi:MAG: DUF4340 domain-containing protein [Bryobacteraceae bacterium]